MLRKEYRIVLPITVEEYQAAQLWSTAEASKNETGGGEGIEVISNEPYEDKKTGEKGQYTHKIYHLASRVPKFIVYLSPKGSLDMKEEAWNAYPNCKTVVTNPEFMKDGFEVRIETIHRPDMGESENVHKLPPKEWEKTTVVKIDIANDPIKRSDYNEKSDPAKFKSEKSGRGPLGKHWIDQLKAQRQITESQNGVCDDETPKPIYMCAYKLVSCKFKWFGIQNRVESMIHTQEQRLFTNFHRQLFCWMDNWFGLTMDDIRQLEDKTKKELDQMRQTGQIRGTKVEET